MHVSKIMEWYRKEFTVDGTIVDLPSIGVQVRMTRGLASAFLSSA